MNIEIMVVFLPVKEMFRNHLSIFVRVNGPDMTRPKSKLISLLIHTAWCTNALWKIN